MSFEVRHEKQREPFFIVENRVMDSDELPAPYGKLVYLCLLRFADRDKQQAYPSVERLAKMCGCSDRTVQKALKQLEELGFIERRARKTTTLYTIKERSWGEGDSGHDQISGEGDSGHELRGEGDSPHPRSTFTPPPKEIHPTPEGDSPKQDVFNKTHLKRHIEQEAEEEEQPPPQANAFETYYISFGKHLNGIQSEVVMKWIDEGIEQEAICHAIKKAAMAGASFKYVQSIVESWISKGIRSLQQALNENQVIEKKAVGGERRTFFKDRSNDQPPPKRSFSSRIKPLNS